jgi:hypothetical protein
MRSHCYCKFCDLHIIFSKHLIPDDDLVMPKHVVHLIFNNCNFELGVTGSISPSLCIVSQWNV